MRILLMLISCATICVSAESKYSNEMNDSGGSDVTKEKF